LIKIETERLIEIHLKKQEIIAKLARDRYLRGDTSPLTSEEEGALCCAADLQAETAMQKINGEYHLTFTYPNVGIMWDGSEFLVAQRQ